MGELALLSSLRPFFDQRSSSLLVPAPDDDAAVLRGDPFVVATTDTMVEEIDFRAGWPGFDYRWLGRRLMSINLSDLAAMGAEPRHALVSLSLRGTMPVAEVHRLYRGIKEQARHFDCALAGGDLSGTLGPLTLTATLLGRLRSSTAVLKRHGARPAWQIAVTGTIGAAAAGLGLLESGRSARTPTERRWIRAQLDPEPQVLAGQLLVRAGVRVGGDISDGLSRELLRITQDEGLGAVIDIDRLPLAAGLSTDDWAMAIRDSEDFQLVCAAPAATMHRAERLLARHRLRLTPIGAIDATPGVRLLRNGRAVQLTRPGYAHFR